MGYADSQNTPGAGDFLSSATTVSPRPKILVMHASVGSGHRSAADAIAHALLDELDSGQKVVPQQPDEVDVEVLDALAFANMYIDGNKTASGFVGAARPFYDIFWRYFLTGPIVWNGGGQWLRVMFWRFLRWVKINDPDAIVCTHIAAANIAVGARKMGHKNYPIICVPTDYEVEGQWPHLNTDLFCAASEYMAETLRARKVPDNRIQITGIPVNPKFSLTYDKAEARRAWGFDDNQKVALVMAGAKLPKPYIRFRDTLFELMPHLHNLPGIRFVFLAGSDAEYAAKLRKVVADEKLQNVQVLDYVTKIPELMAACDFAICKAGGLTVTECLCAQMPMILVGKAYGQEKVNMRLLTAHGAAMHVQTSRELLDALTYVQSGSVDLKSLVRNGEMLRRPYAANDIARSTLRLAYEPISEEQMRERLKFHFLVHIGHWPAHTR